MPCNTYGSSKKQIIPSKHHVSINHDPLLSYPAWHYILTRPAINEYIQKTPSNYWDVVMESLHMIMQAFLLTLGNFLSFVNHDAELYEEYQNILRFDLFTSWFQ